jgi:septal ring factor EnvC (AmiA/AmiB activator)
MRWTAYGLVVVLLLAQVSAAQDQPKFNQLEQDYKAALDQLSAAQKRKNELATENEKLMKEIESLKSQLQTSQERVADLERQADEVNERTFFYRSYYAAFNQFLRLYPQIMARWQVFMENDFLSAPRPGERLADPLWSYPAEG